MGSNQSVHGGRKDTVRDAEDTGWFVWNMATWDLREEVSVSAKATEPDVDEFALAGVEPEPCVVAPGPRVKRSPCHFECRYLQTIRVPAATAVATVDLVIGRVEHDQRADDAGGRCPGSVIDSRPSPGLDDVARGWQPYVRSTMRCSLRLAGPLAVAAVAAASLAACGSSSSSQPAYCSDRSDLQQSVSDLKDVNVTSSGALRAQVSKVDQSARALVASAKSDFPQQTSAISSSVAALNGSARSVAAAPSAKGVVSVGQDVAGVVSAAQAFSDATKDKC
jgi:flavin reductase (DIM6/NTAB) family NADH-FMN oxidoreductase RutF